MMTKLPLASQPPTPEPPLSAEGLQTTVIERADRLQRSFACVRESRWLVDVLNDLKERH